MTTKTRGVLTRSLLSPVPLTLAPVPLILATVLLLLFIAGCGSPAPVSTTDNPKPEPVAVTEIDIDDLLSQGLPVILNFNGNDEQSAETLANLESIYNIYHESILIRSLDLAQNPDAREDFPIQVIPSQLFYTADGLPIPLPFGIGVIMSSFMSVDTSEPVFTMHEGPLSQEDLVIILDYMGVASI